MSKKRYIINFAVIIILAVVSGYFIGSYIAGGKLLQLTNSYSEMSMREIEGELPTYFSQLPTSYFDKLQAKANGKTPDKLNAIDAFMIAEYKTNTSAYIKKVISGTIKAKSMGVNVNQSLISTKIKDGNTIYQDKISYSSMAKVAMKIEHQIGTNNFTYTKGSATSGTTANWDKGQTKELAEYRKMFGSGIDYFENYLITPKTVQSAQTTKVTKSGDNYTFSLAIDIRINESTGEFVYGGVSNYMYEVKTTAGSSDFPVFSYCNLKVTIDKDFRFVKVEAEELYDVVAFGFKATTLGTVTETFSYTKEQ